MTKALEFFPLGPAGVTLQYVVPHLSCAGEVVGREPDPISVASLLATEKLLTLEQPPERILLALIGWEGQLVVTWNSRTLRFR